MIKVPKELLFSSYHYHKYFLFLSSWDLHHDYLMVMLEQDSITSFKQKNPHSF